MRRSSNWIELIEGPTVKELDLFSSQQTKSNMTQKEKAKAYHDIVKMVNAEAAYILERENESHYNDISARAITAASLSAWVLA